MDNRIPSLLLIYSLLMSQKIRSIKSIAISSIFNLTISLELISCRESIWLRSQAGDQTPYAHIHHSEGLKAYQTLRTHKLHNQREASLHQGFQHFMTTKKNELCASSWTPSSLMEQNFIWSNMVGHNSLPKHVNYDVSMSYIHINITVQKHAPIYKILIARWVCVHVWDINLLKTHSRMPPHYAESAGLYTERKSDVERERD